MRYFFKSPNGAEIALDDWAGLTTELADQYTEDPVKQDVLLDFILSVMKIPERMQGSSLN